MKENIRNASVTVGTTSILVSPSVLDDERRVIVIVNTSTGGQIVSLSWGQEAAALKGIVLTPNGSWSESIDTAFTPNPSQVYAIASAAGGTIAVHERIRTVG